MNIYEKRALVSFIGSLGIIAIISGIFLDFDFMYGLIAGITMFILSGVVASWFGVKHVDDRSLPPKARSSLDINQRRSIVSAIAGLGVIAILAGLFLFDFGYGIVAGVSCFLFSGVVATYLGVKGEHQAYDSSQRVQFTNQPIQNEAARDPYYGEPSPKARDATKRFCPNCGTQQQNPDDLYCFSCGTKLD
ncbi:MAG: hypothetical protein ACFFD4_29225 [Candidatus Odinarchaeota archaeon]